MPKPCIRDSIAKMSPAPRKFYGEIFGWSFTKYEAGGHGILADRHQGGRRHAGGLLPRHVAFAPTPTPSAFVVTSRNIMEDYVTNAWRQALPS